MLTMTKMMHIHSLNTPLIKGYHPKYEGLSVHQSGNIWRKSIYCATGELRLVFNDVDGLQNFVTLSEERKLEPECLYRVSMSPITNDFYMTWDLDLEFKGFYCNDYQLLQNELVE